MREAGAEVVLVSGPVALPAPAGVRRVDVETAEELYEKVHEEIGGATSSSAARPCPTTVRNKRPTQKIKRTAAEMELALVRSPDTLASVAALPKPPFTVGFAAETNDVATHAREKLEKKRIDMIAANQVGRDCGFDRETNALTVFWPRRRDRARRRLEARARAPARRAHRGALPRGAHETPDARAALTRAVRIQGRP